MKGVLFVVSGPHGTGKSTLIKKLLDDEGSQVQRTIPYTTRPQRVGEVDGLHYHFVSRDSFEKLHQSKPFVQYMYMYDNHYGTPAEDIYGPLYDGQSLILDLMPRTLEQVRNYNSKLPVEEQVVIKTIFISPPSSHALMARLQGRNSQENTSQSCNFVKRYTTGLNMLRNNVVTTYDYHVTNDSLEETTALLKKIIADTIQSPDVNHVLETPCKPLPDFFGGEKISP